MNDAEITYFLAQLLSASLGWIPAERVTARLAETVEWEKIVEVASKNLVTPALWTALGALNRRHVLPDDLQGYFAEIYRLNAERNREIEKQAIEIALQLNKINVEPLFLKGVVNLLSNLYPNPAYRIMHDIDVLVPQERLQESVHALSCIGYFKIDNQLLFNEKTDHHYPPLASDRWPAVVELHQFLYPVQQYGSLCDTNAFWASSVQRTIYDARFRLPEPLFHIRFHLAHAHKHFGTYGNSGFFLRGFFDFVLLCRKFETQIEWAGLASSFNEDGLRSELLLYLLMARRFCGYGEPLRHLMIGRRERMMQYQVNLNLTYPWIFELWKLATRYKKASLEIASDQERRRNFIKKLKNYDFYTRHFKCFCACFSGRPLEP